MEPATHSESTVDALDYHSEFGVSLQVQAAAAAARHQDPAEAPAEQDAEMADADAPEAVPPGTAEGELAGLTDAQLLEVFKQTSIFNVRSALAGNEALLDGEQLEEGMERYQPPLVTAQQAASPTLRHTQKICNQSSRCGLDALKPQCYEVIYFIACTSRGQRQTTHAAEARNRVLRQCCGERRWSDDDLSDDEGLWNDVRGFWSDDEEESWGRKARARGAKREPRVRGLTHSKPRHDVVTHYNAATQVQLPCLLDSAT